MMFDPPSDPHTQSMFDQYKQASTLQISWIGATGQGCGRTTPGQTGWYDQFDSGGWSLRANIQFKNALTFKSPIFVGGLNMGASSSCDVHSGVVAVGGHTLVSPSKSGFQVHLHFFPGHALTAKSAELKQWLISWYW
jgi:hypothetical protein